MTSRDRDISSEWDPMQDDYNNSAYDRQYIDNDSSNSNTFEVDHKRLYITNIPPGLNENGLQTAFEKYGQVNRLFLSRDPQKRYAMVSYDTESEARIAMMKLNRTEPLNLCINLAHANKYAPSTRKVSRVKNAPSTVQGSAERKARNNDDSSYGDNEQVDESLGFDHNVHLELEKIRLKKLKVEEEKLKCQEKIMLIQLKKPQNASQTSAVETTSRRRLLPDGRVIVQERAQEPDASFTAGAGDSNETTCSCRKSWIKEEVDGSSSQSTCVLCSEDRSVVCSKRDSFLRSDARGNDTESKFENADMTVSKTTCKVSKLASKSDVTSKSRKCPCIVRSEMTCDSKFSDFYSDSEDESDETNRLIQLRNCDYVDIVDDQLKLVIALAGYPKSKMRLRQMEMFQRCLTDVINMQLNANLLQKVPCFLDYYLNRGAIVCVCKDLETRDWMVRVSPGLQERMSTNLVLLNSKVKRLCLAVLKIPKSCWPTSAQDCFKLLQYFNPSLKTNCWKIYAQTVDNDMESTSFLIDRVSGEIIRGPNFKNVIDYDQMEFELTGYTEIYYECLLAGMEEDLRSVGSRVKLLQEIKSARTTPRVASTISMKSIDSVKTIQLKDLIEKLPDIDKIKEIGKHQLEIEEKYQLEIEEKNQSEVNNNLLSHIEDKEYPDVQDAEIDDIIDAEAEKLETEEENNNKSADFRNELERSLDECVLEKIKDVQYIGDNDKVLVWSDDATDKNAQKDKDLEKPTDHLEESHTPDTMLLNLSEKSESVADSVDNMLIDSSDINIDSNRGIAYYRRTNYLHVENELKVAITLVGYPQNKLEGTHIRRLKHLFKEYLHKDLKSQRFANMIIPKFQDIYLSNGAVIYICDSLETKDYLTEVLPKFINSTGLKLTFRDMNNLVRYTRIVMRLPKEHANIESMEILTKLQEKYPHLKPDCWKYYSDVAGKQKRQFGVDPVSLDVIKSQYFDPVYKGEKITFRIIDRQKRDVSYEEGNKEIEENEETKRQRQAIVKKMYAPIDQDILKTPLTKIRTEHYKDLIADDLKLYVGPVNYPETRIDEPQFHTMKRTFEHILVESVEKAEVAENEIPKYHDIYLFDGVTFVICQNMASRLWIEQNVPKVNKILNTNLKSTEFRGAVGIVSMVVKTRKDPDGVIEVLQQQNPRLRTKYWRKISTVKTGTKLDVVLQIDKLSAQVILDPNFNMQIGDETVQFQLGHLRSLIKPKLTLEERTKAHAKKLEAPKQKKGAKVNKKKKKNGSSVSIVNQDSIKNKENTKDENDLKSTEELQLKDDDKNTEDLEDVRDKMNNVDDHKATSNNEPHKSPKLKKGQTQKEHKLDTDDPNIIGSSSNDINKQFTLPDDCYQSKIILKIPLTILPESEEDLNIIFDILEDKNPGLNTEIWQIFTETPYPSNGKFIAFVDRQSLSVIQNKKFDSCVGGEKLMFYF